MTSPDGINWTIRNPPDNQWNSVTFANGLFVAVAANDVMTSPDGINWTDRTPASSHNWRSVTFGNGLFVAVAGDPSGAGNRVMTSPDGVTWTSRTSPADNDWAAVTFGNNLFVAVAQSGVGNRVMTSPDGITWTIRTSAADNAWASVVSGNGVFVAVSSSGSGDRVMTSPDGFTWTSRTSASDNLWRSVAFAGGLFVATSVSGGSDRVMTSGTALNVLTAATSGTGTGTVTSSPAAVSCGASSLACVRGFAPNTVVTLTPSPSPGSAFVGWSGACTGSGACQVTMDAAKSVTADFDASFDLTVTRSGNGSGTVTSAPAGIDCGATCSNAFVDGTVVTLTADPGPNSVFTGFSGACAGTGTCQVTMDQARSVNAEFKPQFDLTVTRSGNGSGTVTSAPAGIDCGTNCSETLLEGAVVTLTANPGQNSRFTGFSGACSGIGSCQVTMSQAKSVDAGFEAKSPATFSKIVLTPKKKSVKSGKTVKLTVQVTNSGELSGTATVKLSSSIKKKATVPKTVSIQVPAGATVKKTFTVKTKKRQKGKVTITAKVAAKSAKSVITLKK